MSRGYPSMTALLGLLAIAGYQNRDKLAELLRGWQSNPGAPQSGGAGGATTGNLGGLLGGTSLGDLLSGGLRDLVDRFNQKGQGEVADSWVNRGPNKQIAPSQLEQAIGPDVLETLTQHTGLSREELLSRLSKNLPEAVDKYTPEGRIPAPADFSRSQGELPSPRNILNRDDARGAALIKSTFGASVVQGDPIRVCVAYVSIWGACFFNYSSDIGWDVDLERVDATISPSSMDTFMPYGQGPVVGPISVSGISIAPRTIDGVPNGNVITVHFSTLSSYSNRTDFLQPAAIPYILVLNNRITGCRR